MLLNQIVEVSEQLKATRSRTAKIDAIARLLQGRSTHELRTTVAWMSGELLQGRIGISKGRAHQFGRDVHPSDLPGLTIEISVLSPLRELGHPLETVVGRHGLYIVQGNQHGVLLPQVAIEQGWQKREFLEAACMKAGLMASSWETIGTRVLVFTAQIMSEAAES